mgnify:CR=1 FL=1|jgi:hypothetical protein
MKDTLKQMWLVTKYVLGFSNNFAREDIDNIKLFRYEVEYTRQILILSVFEVLVFLGILSLTVQILRDSVIIAFFVCLIELIGCLFLFDRLIRTTKTKLQKKYNIHEDD